MTDRALETFTRISSIDWAIMLSTKSCTPLAFSVGSRSSECFRRINIRGFLSPPLVVVGEAPKLNRNREVGDGLGSSKQSFHCLGIACLVVRSAEAS